MCVYVLFYKYVDVMVDICMVFEYLLNFCNELLYESVFVSFYDNDSFNLLLNEMV